ncbi:DUF397 domain-containing protein [Actinokineospora sp.]|uniref:DUF397 domain-containing protein n=1 Tax=Actinokineospora sp. TaxID=1872133 RepID=UPI0040378EA9
MTHPATARVVPRDLAWRKSSFSNDQGACVELAWRKSSVSADQGVCVELACTRGMAVRDSKNPGGGLLIIATAGWTHLLGALRSRHHP